MLISYLLYNTSSLYLQYKVATKRIKRARTFLEGFSDVVPHLPAKILAYIYGRIQAFLCSYVEASEIGDVKFSYLDWDQDLDDLCQGIGTIINMPVPAYVIKAMNSETNKSDPKPTRSKFDKSGASIQMSWNEFFHNGVREKLTKLAHENKDYPPQYLGTPLYLEFHLKGKCHQGSKCQNSSTHTFIKATSFRALMDWSRSILQKYKSQPLGLSK